MPRIQSLDELISRKASEFALEIRAVAAMADKEEEIRVATERQLAFIEKEAGIKLEGRHEFTVASGRIDSVYDRVIIEYKNPSSAGDHIGPRGDSPGSKKVVAQIKKRFYDMRAEHGQPLNTLFGVGLDGNYFIFVRFRDDKWQVQDPVEVNRHSAERFLWALFNLGTAGQPFTPEYLAGDFGAEREGTLARNGVRTLYEAIRTADNPKALTFFNQWKILFGEVCGYDVEKPSEKIRKLAHSYEIPEKGLRTAELLFALHTYYALLMKLLANEIINFPSVRRMTSPLEGLARAATGTQLRRELEKLESGGIFPQLNITNFLEGDLFAWYLPAWSAPIERLVRDMVARLDRYNPDTLSEDPAVCRDLLKKLYHQLFPKSVRHDLGEYYTPDWLAELVLDELGYEGDPDKRLLDPACGSGTFLVMAINRIRRWYDANREARTYDEGELCRRIADNVVGFDLNPLAVLAARTNYLIAIRDLLRHVDHVEIPIYLCDSILAPAEYGESGQEMFGRPMQLQTGAKPTPFFIPRAVTIEREVLARYTNLLAELAPVKSGYSPEEFLQRLEDDGLPCKERDDHLKLFEDLRELDKENKNGVWARIIKNAFAPLFVEPVDYVAGNPPWVNWESLPDDYRDTLKPLWQKYGLFTLSGSAGRLGGGKKDLSMLFVYAAVDDYLKDGGRLGFLITQTVFKTKGAGDGFRQLQYKNSANKKVVIKPVSVHDLSDMQVFEGATNRTAVFICEKQTRAFTYPVPYIQWRGPSRIAQDETLPHVREMTRQTELGAVPVERGKTTSPWLTAPRDALAGIEKVIGKSDYKAYEGVNTGGLNGCYWIRILKELPSGDLLIENMNDVGKIKVERVQAAIEPDLVYPLLRGRDVSRWRAEPSAYVILAQDPEKGKGIAEADMKRKYPKTFKYLKHFEGDPADPKRGTLRGRALYKQYFRPTDPFYSMYNVCSQILTKWKVLWPEVGQTVECGICGPRPVEDVPKPSLPDHTVVAIPCENEHEAYYLAALLNSTPAQAVTRGYIVLHPSPHVLEHVQIPKYSKRIPEHKRLADLGNACHDTAQRDDAGQVHALELEVDGVAASLWGTSKRELNAIRDALAEGHKSHRRSRRKTIPEAREADE